jgi:Thymidylate synthase complementing protein
MIVVRDGIPTYIGDTFQIILRRYSDPDRLNAARNAAIYLGKKDRDNIRRPLSILRQGHVPEVFRGEYAEFEFVDVSKEVYDHLVTYTTRNMRVAGGNRALTSNDFTMPSDKMKQPEKVKACIAGSFDNYVHLLNAGETPQVSRAAMPTAAKMNPFVYTFNFVTLGTAFFKQRIWEKGAQGNTVKVVKGMYELCEYMDKELWDTFYEWYGEPATEWVEIRRKLKKGSFRDSNKNLVRIGTVEEFIDYLQDNIQGISTLESPAEEFLRELFGEQKTMW